MNKCAMELDLALDEILEVLEDWDSGAEPDPKKDLSPILSSYDIDVKYSDIYDIYIKNSGNLDGEDGWSAVSKSIRKLLRKA